MRIKSVSIFLAYLLNVNLILAQTAEPTINSTFNSNTSIQYEGEVIIPYNRGVVSVANNSSVTVTSGFEIYLLPGIDISANNGCNDFLAYIDPALATVIQPSNDRNFEFIKTPNALTYNVADIDDLNIDSKKLDINYFDPLWRKQQECKIQASGDLSHKDIVSVINYDIWGNAPLTYLPYCSSTGTGQFYQDAIEKQLNFYNAGVYKGIATTNYPVSETVSDKSPLNQVNEVGSFGEDWQIGTGHTQRIERSGNGDDEVLLWVISTNGASAMSISSPNYYQQYFLNKTITYSENSDVSSGFPGTTNITYTNNSNQLICKSSLAYQNDNFTRDFSNGGNVLSGGTRKLIYTYYLYDDKGRLVYIIPPEAIANMEISNNFGFEENTSGNWDFIFAFKYDQFNRVVESKTPGQNGYKWYCYNQKDLPVATSLPEQHQNGNYKWTITKYDALGRPIIIGLFERTTFQSLEDMQLEIDGYSANYETRVNNNLGYTNVSFPSQYQSLVIEYYDDYDFSFSTSLNSMSYTSWNGILNSNEVFNRETGRVVKVLGQNKYLSSTFYYDTKGSLIQEQRQNYLDGLDIYNYGYDFRGNRISSNRLHSIPGHSDLSMNSRFIYDNQDRLVNVYNKIGTDQEVELCKLKYNRLGQLINKSLLLDSKYEGGALQNIDYRYNERGWITSINNASLLSDNQINYDNNDVFGEEIYYNNGNEVNLDIQSSSPFTTTNQFNGNISAIRWKNRSMNIASLSKSEHSYSFKYDELSRLVGSYYCGSQPGLVNWFNTEESFFNELYSYDLNGNIMTLVRNYNGILADDMQYEYHQNKLINIVDNSSYSGFGFSDVANTIDYSYDDNGNLKSDLNKGLNSINYNEINLPKQFNSNEGTLNYVYSADGKLQSKTLSNNDEIVYIDGIKYKNSTLEEIQNEDGRIRPKSISSVNSTDFVYDIYLKDHLGSIRTVVTNEENVIDLVATMESSNSSVEESVFYNVAISRSDLPPNYPIDLSYSPNNKASKLNAASNLIGVSKAMRLKEGDQITVDVKYYFSSYPNNNSSLSLNSLLTSLANNFFLSPSNGISIAGSDNSVRQSWSNMMFSNNTFSQNFLNSSIISPSSSTGNPEGYLIYMFYDDNFNFVSDASGVVQVSTPGILGNINITKSIPADGFMYIYTINKSLVDVYFDNLHIKQSRSPEISCTDYYPFGLIIDRNSSTVLSSVSQDMKYIGTELEKDLKLNVQICEQRLYDPVTCRWNGIDPKAIQTPELTPYRYGFNNPQVFLDKNGNFEITAQVRHDYPRVALFLDNIKNIYYGDAIPVELADYLYGIDYTKLFTPQMDQALMKFAEYRDNIDCNLDMNRGILVDEGRLDAIETGRGNGYAKYVDGDAPQMPAGVPLLPNGYIRIDDHVLRAMEKALGSYSLPGMQNFEKPGLETLDSPKDRQRAYDLFVVVLFHETVHEFTYFQWTWQDYGKIDPGFLFEHEAWPGQEFYRWDSEEYDR